MVFRLDKQMGTSYSSVSRKTNLKEEPKGDNSKCLQNELQYF